MLHIKYAIYKNWYLRKKNINNIYVNITSIFYPLDLHYYVPPYIFHLYRIKETWLVDINWFVISIRKFLKNLNHRLKSSIFLVPLWNNSIESRNVYFILGSRLHRERRRIFSRSMFIHRDDQIAYCVGLLTLNK